MSRSKIAVARNLVGAARRAAWMIVLGSVLAAVPITLALPVGAGAAEAGVLVVCPTCDFQQLGDALEAAGDGDRIEVQGGIHDGNLVIDRPVQLIGSDGAVIDAGGQGTVLHITAPDVTVQGFIVRGSGISLDREDSGLLVEGERATIRDNRVEDTLFGIYLRFANDSQILNNVVISKPLSLARRGDGVRTWYSHNVVIDGNTVRDGRDVILWYSEGGIVRNNVFDRGRYGLHLMFSDRAIIEGNSLRGNSVGLYAMYSRDPHIVSNVMADNYGASGIGLGLKDVDDALIEANRIVNNRVGVYVDNSPREIDSEVHFYRNALAYNGIGIGFFPSVRRNTLVENTFEDNIQHVAIIGGGQLRDITWTVDGRGNYWSDYVGYDANRDGVGDVPYRSERLFESVTDDHPSLRLFLFSPAALGIDFAARAFPAVRPQPKLIDTGPLMQPVRSPDLPPVQGTSIRDRLITGGLGLVGIAAFVAGAGRLRRREDRVASPENDAHDRATLSSRQDELPRAAAADSTVDIHVHNLTKHYGHAKALDDVSFDIERGQVVALWGPNGAGKTTVLRCLLGTADFSGDVRVLGRDPHQHGRVIREHIGFVPQEFPIVPMTVSELVSFIAELKNAPLDQAHAQLERLQIADHADKQMSALSGGMKQRVALALALIGAPSILFLDEPTANLDARGRLELLELLRRLSESGMTILISSHRPDDVLALADRVLVIEAGRLSSDLSREEFRRTLQTETRLVVRIAPGDKERALQVLDGIGVSAIGNGVVLTMPVAPGRKTPILSALIRSGIDVDDFELEYGYELVDH
jgi:nitrous oxidase accessory protein